MTYMLSQPIDSCQMSAPCLLMASVVGLLCSVLVFLFGLSDENLGTVQEPWYCTLGFASVQYRGSCTYTRFPSSSLTNSDRHAHKFRHSTLILEPLGQHTPRTRYFSCASVSRVRRTWPRFPIRRDGLLHTLQARARAS